METQFTKREFAKTQTTLLTKSMLIAGIFFIIIGLGSWGFSEVFYNKPLALNVWLPIMLLVMFTSMLISMLWTKVLWQGKAGFTTVLIYAMYVVCESVTFGYLFGLARTAGMNYIWTAFLVTGGVFALCAAIAKLMSLRGIFTLGSMIGAAAIAMGIMAFVALIVLIVALTGNRGAMNASNMLFDILMFVMSFITAGYIIIDIWSISKMSEFANYVGEDLNSGFVWFVGYRLLVDLMNVLLIVVWFMIRMFGRD